ncbi:MAG TPA: PilZ domain-containing protein [Terriglobales bacterium]|nr:PilZ domain-containing protein [Terriglobales bacterium]
MPQKMLEVLMLGRCSHEFSWPRRTGDGDYYQVCLLCAAKYKYDWKTMRRTERVDRNKAESMEEEARARARVRTRPTTWVPRARRLKLDVPLRYRVKNLGEWYGGRIDNLSQSGVLFRGPQSLPENTMVEMIFNMPEEISGQRNSTVLCQGRIIRAKESKKESPKDARDAKPGVVAASILDYIFLHPNRQK